MGARSGPVHGGGADERAPLRDRPASSPTALEARQSPLPRLRPLLLLLLLLLTLLVVAGPWTLPSPEAHALQRVPASMLSDTGPARTPDLPGQLGGTPGGNLTLSSASWPGFAGGGNLSGTSLSAAPVHNGTLWSAYTGDIALPPSGPPAIGSPVVAGGLVYEGTGPGGGVVALNASTGANVWTSTLPLRLPVFGGLLEGDHKVFVPVWQDPSNGSGMLFALNASTGAILWSESVGVRGPLVAPPNLVDGVVLAADDSSSGGYAYGWTEGGLPIFSLPLGGPVDQAISVLSPQQPLALAVAGPHLVAFNATNGQAYPGISWSPMSLPYSSNGSAVQTRYLWRASGTASYEVPLAIVADDAGGSGPSQVQVLDPLGLPGSIAPPSSPVIASWTTPGVSEGFVGSPTILGDGAGNLSFAVEQVNGTVAVFRFALNATGHGVLGLRAFVPWSVGSPTSRPVGSPVSTGGPGGDLVLGTPDGRVEVLSVASRSVLWRCTLPSPVLLSPALANAEVLVSDEQGVLHAIGGSSTPPPASPRLRLTVHAPLWFVGSNRTGFNVSAQVWSPNGTQDAAQSALLAASATSGTVLGSPATANALGVANFTYRAPTVTKETNATIFVNATWQNLTNGTSVQVVIVPPQLVSNTPLSILASPSPPPSVRSAQSVHIVFTVDVGTGGPPLSGALASFTAFGGSSTVASAYTNSSGGVNTTFLAASSSGSAISAGLTLTVEKAGYEIGTYAWVTEVNPLPALVLQFTPGSLLLYSNASEAFQVTVNSTSGVPVANAVVSLLGPSVGGNLSVPGGLTDVRGALEATYTAPSHVRAPGGSGMILVSASASGYATVSGELPLTVVANGTTSKGNSPSNGAGNPLAGLPAWAAWALLALLVALALGCILLLWRRPRAPHPRGRSVWEEFESGGGGSGPAAGSTSSARATPEEETSFGEPGDPDPAGERPSPLEKPER